MWDSNDYIKTWLRSHRYASDTQIRTARQKSTVRRLRKFTKRKIQCGNSCRRMLTLFKLFGVVFLYIWCGNAQARSQNVWYGRQTTTKSDHLNILTPLIFKASCMKRAFVFAYFSWTIVFRFEPENKKSIFIELASLKSLYLVKFQVSTLVKTPRPRLHQKIRDSRLAFRDRYRYLKICGLCQYFSEKKCHHHFEIQIFSNFWHFSYLLWSFLTCRYSRQKARWIT